VPLRLGHVSDEELVEIARAAERLAFSYAEVGASRGSAPSGYRADHYSVVLGDSAATFGRAVDGLRQWRAHRGAHLRVAPPNAPISTGQTVVVAASIGVITAIAPCRIVYVIDESHRFGFAYGTLIGHPERGEESFVISRSADRVTFDVDAFSRPASRLAQLAAPVGRRIQTSTTGRYLSALKDFVEGA
jgi:uncharacterized protein (UPF0548 family)